MKKCLMIVLATCVMFSMAALAQDSMKSDKGTKKAAAKSDMAAETSVNGTITTDKKGKPALKADSDGKVWTITNPEAVKGHEGHHVTVSGHPDAKKNTIHVMKVDMRAAGSAKSDMAAESSVNGTITTDKKGKPALKADSDGKVWTITNPEAVKGHEGHHVTVSGHPDAKAKTIHIMKVDMMAAGSDTGKAKKKSKKKSSSGMSDMSK